MFLCDYGANRNVTTVCSLTNKAVLNFVFGPESIRPSQNETALGNYSREISQGQVSLWASDGDHGKQSKHRQRV